MSILRLLAWWWVVSVVLAALWSVGFGVLKSLVAQGTLRHRDC